MGPSCRLAERAGRDPTRAPPPSVRQPSPKPCCSEAAAAGCTVVTGETMFVGQAADQFRLFTGQEAPVELMRRVVLESLGEAAK